MVVSGEPKQGDEVIAGREAWLRRARERLARPMSLECKRTPLAEALALAAGLSGLAVMTDPAVSLQTPVTLSVKDVPLQQSLERLLGPVGLAFELRDEAVFVRRR